MQVVGAGCAVCSTKIVTAREGQVCPSCGAALHDACSASHACAGPRKSPPVAAPPFARSRAMRIGAPILGVLVAATVVPRFRAWQTERRVAERAAHRLGCAASEIEIVRGPGSGITARGCGTSVYYLRTCGQIDKPECLQEIEVQYPR